MTDLVDPDDLVGPADIARRTGVKVGTVRQWHRRGILPAPCAVVSGVPIWQWEEVEPILVERVGRFYVSPKTAPVTH